MRSSGVPGQDGDCRQLGGRHCRRLERQHDRGRGHWVTSRRPRASARWPLAANAGPGTRTRTTLRSSDRRRTHEPGGGKTHVASPSNSASELGCRFPHVTQLASTTRRGGVTAARRCNGSTTCTRATRFRNGSTDLGGRELWSRSFAGRGTRPWNPPHAVGVRRLAGLTSGPHPVLPQCLRALHLAHTTRRSTARCVKFAATAPLSACSSPCIDPTACAPVGRRRTGPWT